MVHFGLDLQLVGFLTDDSVSITTELPADIKTARIMTVVRDTQKTDETVTIEENYVPT